jgi:hypothetical protein
MLTPAEYAALLDNVFKPVQITLLNGQGKTQIAQTALMAGSFQGGCGMKFNNLSHSKGIPGIDVRQLLP